MATKTAKPTHPSYADMICAALEVLGGKKGASRQSINKYIVKEYNLTENQHHSVMLNNNLKRASTSGGPIVHSKGTGAAGSFKLNGEPAPAPAKKTKPAATKAPKKKTSTKKAAKASSKKGKVGRPKKVTATEEVEDSKPKVEKAAKSKVAKAKTAKKSKAATPKKPAVKKSPRKK